MNHLFGSRQKAIDMIESLVAGQGENADEKWVKVILLYKKWQIQFSNGELPDPPTLNQVCHSLNFDAGVFLGELQMGIQSLMTKMAHIKASMVATQIVDNLNQKALSEEADVKEIELALKIGGVIDERGGLNVQINNNNNNNVMLKSEKEKMKSPLLQFSDTVIDIDDEARREETDRTPDSNSQSQA
jgi:hypothetical protein